MLILHNFRLLSVFKRYCYKKVRRADVNLIKSESKEAKRIDQADHNSLNEIKYQIKLNGPITVAKYMQLALTNALGNSGYYMNRGVIGKTGDFITSPEINQIFGEVIAVWCINELQTIQWHSKPLQIVELGPGKGTLLLDLIRVFSHFELTNYVSLHLVEISPYFSQIQADTLCLKKHWNVEHGKINDHNYYKQGITPTGINCFWYRKIEDVPNLFSIYLAHEFFDALPIHKFQLTDNYRSTHNSCWREVLIDYEKDNLFKYVLSRYETAALSIFKQRFLSEVNNRSHIEYSIKADSIMEILIEKIESNGGFALIMDYGHYGDKEDTFRAFRSHKLCDPLLNPGTADLTADVDFLQLKRLCEKNDRLIVFGPIEQKKFITFMNGSERLEQLIRNAEPHLVNSLQTSYNMLIDPKQMGSRFKFMSLYPSVLRNKLKSLKGDRI